MSDDRQRINELFYVISMITQKEHSEFLSNDANVKVGYYLNEWYELQKQSPVPDIPGALCLAQVVLGYLLALTQGIPVESLISMVQNRSERWT